MAATNTGRPVRQPDASHPDLVLHPEGSIADARNDLAKLRNRPPVRFTSMFADASADAGPIVDYHLDLTKATRAQLVEASAYADAVVPAADTIESHREKLDARLGKLRELMQADQSAGKAAQHPMSNTPQQLPPALRAGGFQSFTPPADPWAEAHPAPSAFGVPYDQHAPAPAQAPVAPPFFATGPAAPQPPAPHFAPRQPAAPAPFFAQKQAAAPAPVAVAVAAPAPPAPRDLRPAESAMFYFPQGAFPGNYHHIDVQRAADGRPVAIYLVYDNRFGVAPPFMATDVEGEFGLSVRGSSELYTVEATGLLHEFLDYTIGVLMVNQAHPAPDRG